jgi:hypothetical protein
MNNTSKKQAKGRKVVSVSAVRQGRGGIAIKSGVRAGSTIKYG